MTPEQTMTSTIERTFSKSTQTRANDIIAAITATAERSAAHTYGGPGNDDGGLELSVKARLFRVAPLDPWLRANRSEAWAGLSDSAMYSRLLEGLDPRRVDVPRRRCQHRLRQREHLAPRNYGHLR